MVSEPTVRWIGSSPHGGKRGDLLTDQSSQINLSLHFTGLWHGPNQSRFDPMATGGLRKITHRKGEEENTEKIEKARSGSRFLTIVGKKSVKTVKLKKKDPFRKQRGRFA